MSRVLPKEFIDTRARFHRISDARIFHGWIVNFYGSRIYVEISSEAPIQHGEEFRFEVQGRKISAVFEAKVANVEEFDLLGGGVMYEVQGTSTQVIEASRVTVEFTIVGGIRYGGVIQPYRLRVSRVPVIIDPKRERDEASLVDISEGGFAALTSRVYEPGTEIQFEVDTTVGAVLGSGRVCYCRMSEENGIQRVGVEFKELGRLDAPRWNRFMEEISG